MSLSKRRPRPLTRDRATYRDDRLFIIGTDDTHAPKQYFEFFPIPRIHVHVIPTTDGDSHARHVLERLLSIEHEPDDQLWMLLDTDHCIEQNHIQAYLDAIKLAKQKRVNIAISRPCFEFWLLLHHSDQLDELSKCAEVEKELRSRLGKYNKTRLRREDYPAVAVAEACARAIILDKAAGGGEIPSSNTTRVYHLWKAIVESASPAQLPPGFDALRSLFVKP